MAKVVIGALIIDKPEGLTSHDVVARVRRATGTQRVGHAGTLDPFATGVLVCCVGRATRLAQFLVGLDKEYLATVRLGYATDTQDRTGKQITPLRSSNVRSLEELQRILNEFTGPQLQMPPMFSAKKVSGERLYRAARAGREVKREPVRIAIYSIAALGDDAGLTVNDDGTVDFRALVRCSSGTYVRTLAHDIGERLGAGAHLLDLRRTAVGHFLLNDALTLSDLEAMSHESIRRVLITPSEMLSHLPMIRLDEARVRKVTTGQSFLLEEEESAGALSRSAIRLCDRAGQLLGVGGVDQAGEVVKPIVVLGVG